MTNAVRTPLIIEPESPEPKEAFYKTEWYGVNGAVVSFDNLKEGILAVWDYTVIEPGTSRLAVDIYPFNDSSILGNYDVKLNSKISVIRAFGTKQIVIKTEEIAMTPKQYEQWFKGLALAMRFRDAIENNKIKRACAETGWLEGRAPANKQEVCDLLIK